MNEIKEYLETVGKLLQSLDERITRLEDRSLVQQELIAKLCEAIDALHGITETLCNATQPRIPLPPRPPLS